MTDDLPQLVPTRLLSDIDSILRKGPFGSRARKVLRDAATALDTLTRALAAQQAEAAKWKNELVRLDTGMMETLEGDWSTDDGEGQPPEKVVDHLFVVVDSLVEYSINRVHAAESTLTAAVREARAETWEAAATLLAIYGMKDNNPHKDCLRHAAASRVSQTGS